MTTFQTFRQIPTSPAGVFGAFAQPNRLATWWGPEGAQCANESAFEEIEATRKVVAPNMVF